MQGQFVIAKSDFKNKNCEWSYYVSTVTDGKLHDQYHGNLSHQKFDCSCRIWLYFNYFSLQVLFFFYIYQLIISLLFAEYEFMVVFSIKVYRTVRIRKIDREES